MNRNNLRVLSAAVLSLAVLLAASSCESWGGTAGSGVYDEFLSSINITDAKTVYQRSVSVKQVQGA